MKFYNEYFNRQVAEWVDDLSLLYAEGLKTASRFGLRAMDALHITAALIADCDEFITAEKPTSPFNRVVSITVLSIY